MQISCGFIEGNGEGVVNYWVAIERMFILFNVKYPVDEWYIDLCLSAATCIPVTSTLRLCLEECLSHLSFSLTYKGNTLMTAGQDPRPCLSFKKLSANHTITM